MINEFAGRSINTVVLPGNNETTVPTLAGEQWLANNSLPRRSWASFNGIKLFDIFMIVVLAVFFDVLGCYLIERNREWYFFQIRRLQLRIFSNRFKGKKKGKDDQTGEKDDDVAEEAPESTEAPSWPNTLVVKNISYFVPLRGPSKSDKDELQLLKNVTAIFKRGRMTALMVRMDGNVSLLKLFWI